MDSIFEVHRQTHEETERFERALYTILSRPTHVHQTRLQNEHKASQILDRVSSRVTALNSLYEDEDARKAEASSLSAPNQNGAELSEFYSRLAKIQEHHNKYPDAGADGYELELAALLNDGGGNDDTEEDYMEEDRESLCCLLLGSFTHVFRCVSCSGWYVVLWRGGIRQIP